MSSSSSSGSGKFVDFDAGRDHMVEIGELLLREVDMNEGVGSEIVLEDGRVYLFSGDVRYRGKVMTEWLLRQESEEGDVWQGITEMDWFGKRLSPVSSSSGSSPLLFPEEGVEQKEVDEDDVPFGILYGPKKTEFGSSDDTDASDPGDKDYLPDESEEEETEDEMVEIEEVPEETPVLEKKVKAKVFSKLPFTKRVDQRQTRLSLGCVY